MDGDEPPFGKTPHMDAGDPVARFTHEVPSVDAYWRAIILFGQNVASSKFALGGAPKRLRPNRPRLTYPRH